MYDVIVDSSLRFIRYRFMEHLFSMFQIEKKFHLLRKFVIYFFLFNLDIFFFC